MPKFKKVEPNQEEVNKGIEDLTNKLKFIEDNFLSKRAFIAGDQPTIADIMALTELMQPLVGKGKHTYSTLNIRLCDTWVISIWCKDHFFPCLVMALFVVVISTTWRYSTDPIGNVAKPSECMELYLENRWCCSCLYVAGGYPVIKKHPVIGAWMDRIKAKLGKLFNESHYVLFEICGIKVMWTVWHAGCRIFEEILKTITPSFALF